MKTICGLDCNVCDMKDSCKGCKETNAHPFGGDCVVACHCEKNNCKNEKDCQKAIKEYKDKLINEFNGLGIKDMPKIKELYQLNGAFINMEYVLDNGQKVKFWQDNNIYLGNQVEKENSNLCYGLAANDKYLMVCEYGENGINPEVVIFKRR